MSRVYNFSAGPAALPEAVLQQAKDEMLDWHGSGMSVMEMSHRGKEFMSIAAQAEADLREIMQIPEHYKVLFMQGGASQQFAMIPLNFMAEGESADYVDTGLWSKKAIAEAKRLGNVNVVASSRETGYNSIPAPQDWQFGSNARYLHYTPNETIGGVEFHWIPAVENVPLVADMSSTILSRPVDVSQFGMIYAGAQKNIGPAGLTLAIIREDLIGKARESVPAMLNYQTFAENESMYNTPPTYAWYLSGLVFAWIKQQGGLSAMAEVNYRKARMLYDLIDNSDFYANPVPADNRSWMNVPFTLADAELDGEFLKQASERGLKTLKGHRSVGGMRASIYNAMPEAGVQALCDFMREFEQSQG